MRIDAHQHFWSLQRGDYSWPTPDLTELFRNFGPADLAPLLAAAGIDGTVLVQATPTAAETSYLLGIARHEPFVKAVIGWADLAAPDAARRVDLLARDPWLKGLRPMIQAFPDDRWMLRAELTPAFAALARHGLVLDALVQPRHLPILPDLLDRHPDLVVVIDHGAKPAIARGDFAGWARDIAVLARREGVYCKLSGLWTEAGGNRSAEAVGPYIAHLLACFGPRRILWGSDWPVLRLAGDYADWHAQCRAMTGGYSKADRDDIFGGTARRVYGLR
ncbi:amidohydrolase family protein [Sphingomonas sp. AR_OL41]|uniref:amidohydrolase family protein n=1 Tax=Sphingomonas sp. AR_OL41 TaxID=3042729 RepID=UPI002481708B|nr:amidohydrolase family protein [Sphingomonas sp. AR_OL41]MDH7973901.1 amidohydrolase family protein [Sphingomonas sp. AR_OL41]